MDDRIEFGILTAHAAAMFACEFADECIAHPESNMPFIYQRLESVDRIWSWTKIDDGSPNFTLIKAALFYGALERRVVQFKQLEQLIGNEAAELVKTLSAVERTGSTTKYSKYFQTCSLELLLIEIASALSRGGKDKNFFELFQVLISREAEVKTRFNAARVERIKQVFISLYTQN